jgi:UTP--glucose-1-phosphate uridylyltransferase
LSVNHPLSADTGIAASNKLADFVEKMRAAGQPELVIRHFAHQYERLLAGATGYIDRREALPVESLQSCAALSESYTPAGVAALSRTAVAKLNGGLGTSMGMAGPKSLLPVKDDLTFLDVILRQVMYARGHCGCRIPLLLMDSFNTFEDTKNSLEKYREFSQDVPISFMQHRKPKIWKDSLEAAEWPADPDKEWCPPGHGDIYISLVTSGTLDALLDAGYEYLFVSNSDNLGAVLDLQILGYLSEEEIPFLMEVADRTESDNKGGHLAMRPDGQLILRELSQCPPNETDEFQDIERFRYFNTNNLWLHLPTLQRIMTDHDEILELPLIRNEKPIDPADTSSPRVYQLETAMGSAIALFPGAHAIRVPRSRFAPVKRTSDLLVMWSDAYEFADNYQMVLSSKREVAPSDWPPIVRLDPVYFQMVDDMRTRFPKGAPSLLNCRHLIIDGDVNFGGDVAIEGDVTITNRGSEPLTIADGARLGSLQLRAM